MKVEVGDIIGCLHGFKIDEKSGGSGYILLEKF